MRCEVARALRPVSVRQKFAAFWDVVANVATDNRLWLEVEQTLWNLDRQGVILPLTDVVIACCALRIGAVVLTHDRHFQLIPGLGRTDQLRP